MKSDPDLDHLRLLSIFHYVVAGLVTLASCALIFHLLIGLAVLFGVSEELQNNTHGPPPLFFGVLFTVIPACFMLCGFTLALCLAIAGRSLSRCRRYTFCLVIAAIECLFMPFGTALGIFTIIVLSRPTVKDLFASNS